jgi:hypothetical protein
MVKREEGWLSGWVGDDLVMMNARSSEYVSLSPTGARIWELIESPRTLASLCEALTEEFEITADAAAVEVIEFLKDMEQHHVVRLGPIPG